MLGDIKNELVHYGVLGMKWGIRKQKSPKSVPKNISDLKKDIKRHRTEYRRANKVSSSDRFMSNYRATTGKHYAETLKKSKQEIEEARNLLQKKYKTALQRAEKSEDWEKYADISHQYESELTKAFMKANKQLTSASIKDVGYVNVAATEKFIADNNIQIGGLSKTYNRKTKFI